VWIFELIPVVVGCIFCISVAIGIFAGMFAYLATELKGMGVLGFVENKKNADVLERVISELYTIDRWCASDPKVVATVQRILDQIRWARGENVITQDIGEWREKVLGPNWREKP
jgi:hypothetical protein